MKINAKQYAQALLDLIEGKDEKASTQVIVEFSKTLKKNNQLAQLEKIIYYFKNLYNKRYSIVEAEVVSKEALSEASLKEVTNYLNNLDKDKNLELSQTSSNKIIGGIVIKYGDKILDNSLRTRLNQLKTSLLK
jgi:F-type H+-transporting ATPase subunit delta